MFTLTADAHPLISRMHSPTRCSAPTSRASAVWSPSQVANVDAWLFGTLDVAQWLVRLSPLEVIDAAPA